MLIFLLVRKIKEVLNLNFLKMLLRKCHISVNNKYV